jgi:putative ABC transport system permease protein
MLGQFRIAVRMLAKTPAFTAVAVLALALGIGASTTVFSAVNALLVRPWPHMKDDNRVLFFSEYFTKMSDRESAVAYPDYLDFKQEAKTVEVGASEDATFILSGSDKPERYLGSFISADAFSFLGVKPALGRLFRPDEDQPNAAPVALLGYDVWTTHFGSDRGVIGRVVTLNGKRATIVGVMPLGWRFPTRSDLWMPLGVDAKEQARGKFYLLGFARLKDGVSLATARSELETIAARVAAQHPDTNTGASVHVRTFREEMTKEARTLTLLLMGAVLFVHLIACANVANLLLARAATRSREIGIRLALGASRSAVVRHLLTESIVLGVAGAGLGLLFAVWGIDLMVKALPADMPYFLQFDLDWRILCFAVALGLGSAIAFGLFPALQVSDPQLVNALKEGGRGGVGGGRSQRVRNALVVAEVALALVLLAGAGVMVRSFFRTQAIDIGIDPSNTLTFRAGLPPSQFKAEEAGRFFAALMPRLKTIPGVISSGATAALPTSGNVGGSAVAIDGEPDPKELQNARIAHGISITPGYFATGRISLLRGRDFTDFDNEKSQRVCLIDEVGARTWFPNTDPIGHRVRMVAHHGEESKVAMIIGVVHQVIYERLVDKRDVPCVYVSQFQEPDSFMSVVLRTRSNPRHYLNLARSAVLAANKEIPIYRVFTMDEIVQQSFWERRFFGVFFAIFAALALFLAALGLYGVMAYSVRQRTQEIGVRMALGAQAADVLRLVTGHGMRLILVGLALGFVGALALTRLLQSNLEGISPRDPLSFTIVSLVLLAAGLVACYLPARAAMRLDPVEALRYE